MDIIEEYRERWKQWEYDNTHTDNKIKQNEGNK